MENMIMMKNINVLITGHTGFKGSWLTSLLIHLDANVYGYSLQKNASPIYKRINSLGLLSGECIADINDEKPFKDFLKVAKPEIVFHLAAQPLVNESYIDPINTFNTNVVGTAKVLNSLRDIDSISSIVVITTDKCYLNNEWCWPYRETDALGGHDPYSASKACTELVVDSFRKSYFDKKSILISTLRAGNVIGGGDLTSGRLLPDISKSVISGNRLQIRNPSATRPWQHVLDPILGYVCVALKMRNKESDFATAWNFGPSVEGNRSVGEILQVVSRRYKNFKWNATEEPAFHEANLLSLDSSKANTKLSWTTTWDLNTSIEKTLDWYIEVNSGKDPLDVTFTQLKDFLTKVSYDF